MGRMKDKYFNEINSDDDGNGEFEDQSELNYWRKIAEKYIHDAFLTEMESVWSGYEIEEGENLSDMECAKIVIKSKAFFKAIWHASTEILPKLEVQVVLDGSAKIFVTTGSSGYVEFGLQPPIGLKLPIKCWIHTHPFASAYFSGTDWMTVGNWKSLMEEAYVLGGVEHYGHWVNTKPNNLLIRWVDNNGLETFKVQQQRQIEGEEE